MMVCLGLIRVFKTDKIFSEWLEKIKGAKTILMFLSEGF